MASAIRAVTKKPQPEPDINITPLVDVVLVLLIIFMVITPELAKNPVVELPSAKQVDEEHKTMDALDVVLKKDGQILLEDKVVTEPELLAQLGETRAANPDRVVVLQADAMLPYKDVRALFASMQKTGTRGVSLKVVERK